VERKHWQWIGALGAAVLAFLGCRDEQIEHYQVARLDREKPMQRLLGAIIPREDRTWFFKLMGPAPGVAEQKETFDRFLRSVRFTGKKEAPLDWTVPEGWQKLPAADMRYATFLLGTKENPLELTVTDLGKEAASIPKNINRWRGQLGLKPLTEGEIEKEVTKLEIGGTSATLVDMTGPGSRNKGMRPPVEPAAAPRAARPGLKYQKPDTWKEEPADSSFGQLAAFQVVDGSQTAKLSISLLGGQAGSLLPNVNRWRSQVNLEPIGTEQLRRDLRQIQVGGKPAAYIDILGAEARGGPRERILGVVLEDGPQTWFFKMKGPSELVAKQQVTFESFVGSVSFDGERGDKP
jgi:hypothetical protein